MGDSTATSEMAEGKQKMNNQKGFMGCGSFIIISWLALMLAFWGLIVLNKNIFHVPHEKAVFTSLAAARRCREKLELFRENSYVKDVLLNELEINSVLSDEFAHGHHKPIVSLSMKLEPDNLKIECVVIFIDLFPQVIRTMLLSKSKKQREEYKSRRLIVKMDCQPVIETGGTLFLNPGKLVIGKQKIPFLIIKIIDKVKPNWFRYPVSEEISYVRIGEGELEIAKADD